MPCKEAANKDKILIACSSPLTTLTSTYQPRALILPSEILTIPKINWRRKHSLEYLFGINNPTGPNIFLGGGGGRGITNSMKDENFTFK
jgi:hypothetical protein